MRYTYLPLFIYLVLYTGLLSAQTDSTSGPQLSYSLNLYTPFGKTAQHRGASVDVEARLSKHVSLLLNVGRLQSQRAANWLGLPFAEPVGGELSPPWPDRRLAGPILLDTRRLFLGLGTQGNLRLGSGDIALSALLTLGTTHLRQSASFGDLSLPADGSAAPVGLFGTATIDYHPVLQLGSFIQLHYTYWFSRHLALRIGTGVHSYGLATWGNYREGEPARYSVREITYRGDYRPGIGNYALPTEENFTTPDPTIHRYYLWGLNFGIVYKPAKPRT